MIFNLLQAGDAELLETAVQAVAQEKTLSLIDLAVAGGWLMIVLLILSVMAIYIFGNKWWMIRKAGNPAINIINKFEDGTVDAATQTAVVQLFKDMITKHK